MNKDKKNADIKNTDMQNKNIKNNSTALQKKDAPQKKYPWSAKRIAAWICILALAAMYLITLILALTDHTAAGSLFKASLLLTIVLPIFCWIFIWAVGVLTHRETIASMKILNSNPAERKKMEDALQSSQELKDAQIKQP